MSRESQELTEILERTSRWSPGLRIRLARRLLESVDPGNDAPPAHRWRAADVIAAINSPQPAPDDETVKQWIDEHRMEKYGQ